MQPDSESAAPPDPTAFLFPAEWEAVADIFGDTGTALIFLRDGVIARVNRQLTGLLGFQEEELVGKPVEALFPANGNGLRADGGPYDSRHQHAHGTRIRLVDRNGDAIDFHLIVNRIDTLSDAHGAVWVLLAAHQPADEPPRDASRMRMIVDRAPDLICLCDAQAVITYANPAFSRAVTDRIEHLVRLNIADLVHREDRDALLAVLRQAADASPRAVHEIVFRLREHGGSWRRIDARAVNPGGNQAVREVLLYGRDVSEQMLRQQNLLSEQRRQLHYLNRLLRIAQHPQTNPEQALKVIVKAAAKALNAHRCAYWVVDDDPAATRCVAMYDDIRQNFDIDDPGPAPAIAFHSLLRQIRIDEETLVASDVDLDPRAALSCEYFHATGIKAVMLAPIYRDKWRSDRVVGILMLADRHAARAWRKDEETFARNAADLVAHAFSTAEQANADARNTQSGRRPHLDELTGLPNRRFLFERPADLFPKITETSRSLAAFLINLDGFKGINDALGREIGDALLRAAALRLKNVVRDNDILARLSGDEFMLVARNLSDMRIADEIALQIVETMRNTFVLQGHELQVSASVGIALYPFDGTNLDTLMQKAAVAMRHAKSRGIGRHHIYTPALEKEAAGRTAQTRRTFQPDESPRRTT